MNTEKQVNTTVTMELAHRRLGHASSERLRYTTTATTGLAIGDSERPFCEACALGESRRQPHPKQRQHKPIEPFEMVSSDIKGPFLTPCKEVYRYYITFNCHYTTWSWAAFLKHKSADEFLNATKIFLTNSQSETRQRMALFLTDNGSEYVNGHMSTFFLQKNIKHHRTVPYCPQQNGQSERRNQTIMNMAWCIIIESKLPYEFWPFAVNHAVYTMNRLPTRRIQWKTPYEAWTGTKPDISNLRPFGCTSYAHIDSSLRTSIEQTSTRCKFLGYAEYQKGYILLQIEKAIIFVRRNVTFEENSMIEITPVQTALSETGNDPMETLDEHEFVLQPLANLAEVRLSRNISASNAPPRRGQMASGCTGKTSITQRQ